ERLMRIAAAPLVPLVLLGRIALGLRSRGQSVITWLPALPALLPLLAAWSLGEARGMGSGLFTSSFPRAAWECRPGRSAASGVAGWATQSVEDGIPTGTVGTR